MIEECHIWINICGIVVKVRTNVCNPLKTVKKKKVLQNKYDIYWIIHCIYFGASHVKSVAFALINEPFQTAASQEFSALLSPFPDKKKKWSVSDNSPPSLYRRIPQILPFGNLTFPYEVSLRTIKPSDPDPPVQPSTRHSWPRRSPLWSNSAGNPTSPCFHSSRASSPPSSSERSVLCLRVSSRRDERLETEESCVVTRQELWSFELFLFPFWPLSEFRRTRSLFMVVWMFLSTVFLWSVTVGRLLT